MSHTTARLAWLLLPVLATSSQGAVLHVPAEYPDIQSAVDAASTADTVLVAPGTYTGPGNRNINYHGVDLALISEAGAAATVIDCEGLGRGFDFRSMETAAALLEGFTITNGRATALNFPGSFAAGVSCRGHSNPTIRDCVLVENHAVNGGGIGMADSAPTLIGCVIAGNLADESGGGVTMVAFSAPVFEDCLITGNKAPAGAGVQMNLSSLAFQGCTIAANSADGGGGGILVDADSTPAFERCILWGNCGTVGESILSTDPDNVVSMDCCAVDSSEVSGDGIAYGEDNVFTNPFFCDPLDCADAPSSEGDFGLHENSPCVAELSPCGQRIGALDAACGPVSSVPDPAGHDRTSWGRIKSDYGPSRSGR